MVIQPTWCTLWLFNIAMENDSFIDDFHIKTTIYRGFSRAMSNNQMVTSKINMDYNDHSDMAWVKYKTSRIDLTENDGECKVNYPLLWPIVQVG